MRKHTRSPQQLPLPIEGQTVEIELTRGYATVVDAIDADLAEFNWYTSQTSSSKQVYAIRKVVVSKKSTRISLHRLILERIIGRELRSSEFVDHIDLNGLNNRRSNLRLATHAQNLRNVPKRATNTSGFKGVSYFKETGKWKAQISHNKKVMSIGYYDTPEEAYQAYCKVAKELHGEFFNPG